MKDRMHQSPVTRDVWTMLRGCTSARIALGRAGGSLPTRDWLEFKAAHAAAREAVLYPFDAEKLADEIARWHADVVVVDSAANDRTMYLQRPDLGRRLSDRSRWELQQLAAPERTPDLVIVVSDGLSALAVHRQAPSLLNSLLPKLAAGKWQLAPIVVARFGRVALQDEIGQVVGARLALTLLGERPGLTSPDSLGAYLVYAPRIGNTDANRNCVSNIRPEGLALDAAADTIYQLLTLVRRRGLSGVRLKDERHATLELRLDHSETAPEETS